MSRFHVCSFGRVNGTMTMSIIYNPSESREDGRRYWGGLV